jgi:hypothetical protein
LENKKKISTLLRQKNFEKCINVLETKLHSILDKNNFSVINNLSLVNEIQESVYKIIKDKQILRTSIQLQSEIDSIIYSKKKLLFLPNKKLYIILRTEEQFMVIDMDLENIINYFEGLYRISEGELVIVSCDYSNGLCLEHNHYFKNNEFEVTYWSNI